MLEQFRYIWLSYPLVKSERLHPLEAIESYTFGFGRSVRPRPWSPRQILGFRA